MAIVRVTEENAAQWAKLCNELWPHNTAEDMMEEFNSGILEYEYLYQINGVSVAFISLSLRNDYVEGKIDAGPVGYVEGIYVKPEYRRKGIAKALVQFSKEWSIERGCRMLASDCELTNESSRLFHNKIGFIEVNINVHFAMPLTE